MGTIINGAADYTEIVVIRHGETKWNADKRLQGHLDVELNEVGREQAAAVANRLSKEAGISTFYSSDLTRAYETAQIIANKCGGFEVVQKAELRERNLGDLQGLVLKEAEKLKPDAYQAFVSRTRDQDIPGGGESLNQLYNRCTSALQQIGEKHRGERVVVVTHGGVVRAFHKRANPKERSPGKIENTSVNVFHLYENGDWVITLWGDISHLDDDMVLESGFGGLENSG
ncbi:phosphoglycerate mutase (2,3-diphosphoglycerate-independent) [Ranunculus cassubicifolius]